MKLILPLFVDIPRKKLPAKRFYLGLNPYRNTHFQILNKAKAIYSEWIKAFVPFYGDAECFSEHIIDPPYRFVYTIFPSSGRRFDLANVLPIIQKFTDDSLIEMGIISDDSWKVIKAIDYRFGGIDKENPRAELEIFSWKET